MFMESTREIIADLGIFWYKKGTRIMHRTDGPALEYINGTKFWYQEGKFHRDDGPAVEFYDGTKEWWYHGKRIRCSTNQEFQRLLKLKAFW